MTSPRRRKARLKLPPEHQVVDVSADGKTLLTKTSEHESPKQMVFVVPVATLKPEPLSDTPLVLAYSPRFSPDGKRVLWAKVVEGQLTNPEVSGVFITDVATKKDTRVKLPDGVGGSQFCWSPDGKRIAMSGERSVSNMKGADTISEVTVCDADGSNAKVIVTRGPSKQNSDERIRGLDWR